MVKADISISSHTKEQVRCQDRYRVNEIFHAFPYSASPRSVVFVSSHPCVYQTSRFFVKWGKRYGHGQGEGQGLGRGRTETGSVLRRRRRRGRRRGQEQEQEQDRSKIQHVIRLETKRGDGTL